MKSQTKRELLATLLAVVVIGIAVFFISNLSLTGFAIETPNTIEKTIEIQVWAETLIELNSENGQIRAHYLLDNNTEISNQEIEFYLEKELIFSNKTNEQGYTKSLFNLSQTGPGTYSLSLKSQGSDTLYTNPTETNAQIEILGSGEIIILDPEFKEIAISEEKIETINETEIILLQQDNLNCQEFEEQVLWSSGFSSNENGSESYNSWSPENNCSSINQSNCVIGSLDLHIRTFYSSPFYELESGESSVQISKLENCENPESGSYLQYLAYESLNEGDVELNWYCGENTLQESCNQITNLKPFDFEPCFGIKTQASQYNIADVVEIKYNLCLKGGTNES